MCFIRPLLVFMIVAIVLFVTAYGDEMTPRAKFLYGIGAGMMFYVVIDELSWKAKFKIYFVVLGWIAFLLLSGKGKW